MVSGDHIQLLCTSTFRIHYFCSITINDDELNNIFRIFVLHKECIQIIWTFFLFYCFIYKWYLILCHDHLEFTAAAHVPKVKWYICEMEKIMLNCIGIAIDITFWFTNESKNDCVWCDSIPRYSLFLALVFFCSLYSKKQSVRPTREKVRLFFFFLLFNDYREYCWNFISKLKKKLHTQHTQYERKVIKEKQKNTARKRKWIKTEFEYKEKVNQ